MPLKNYTTEVSARKSIAEIQSKLVDHGATSMIIDYGPDKEPVSLSFIVPTSQGNLPFRLPAKAEEVEKILLGMRRRVPETWHYDYDRVMDKIRKQAARVAWRIIRDWIDAQLAIIETEMVTIDQVFLPYMLMDGGSHTLYETLVDRGFLLKEGQG